jgi:phosphate transport system substrate-binding protein
MEEMRRVKAIHLIAGLVLFALVGAACSSKTPTASTAFKGVALNGAGATFPAPAYDALFKTFHDTIESGAAVNYSAVGSGAGITQITAKTVDFGASDAPLKDSEAAAAPGLLEIPTVLGAVVLAYNIPGVPTGLKLTPEAISGIFLNKIQFWDDAAIKDQNSGVTLPHKQIVSVHRKDSSGTTFVFTSYLSKVSTQWANDSKLGAAKSVTWPSGLQGDGNAGVAQKIGSVQYSIGYVELAYALSNTITYASVKAPSGDFVAPSIDSVTPAGSGLTFPIGPKTNVLNSAAAGAYPISTTTYLLVYKDQTDKDKAQTLVDLIYWIEHKGADVAKSQNYAPLPSSALGPIDALLAQINVSGTPVTPSSAVTG